MNLADAIRRAAQAAGRPDPGNEATFGSGTLKVVSSADDLSRPLPRIPLDEPYRTPSPKDAVDKEFAVDLEEDVEVMFLKNGAVLSTGEAPQAPNVPTSAVRLELFLAPDQVGSLMRSVFSTQHSVMTLREAAHFLRIPGATLEQLANDHSVPAFQVDGKWRFSKPALDEWMNSQDRQRDVS